MRIIRGKYGRRRFDVPKNITARPTTDFARENIFNVIENMLDLDGAEALDLFAGTGAVSFEFLSRGCSNVTCVEKAYTQYNFIRNVKGELNATGLSIVRGDVFRFINTCDKSFDIIFADPPYDLPQLPEIPAQVLGSSLVKPGTVFIMEHSKNNDFSNLPEFVEHRVYGSVNFSIFVVGDKGESDNCND